MKKGMVLALSMALATAAYGQDDGAVVAVDEGPASFWDGWTGGFELGLNGSSGNTERLSFRVGASAGRITDELDTKASVIFSYAKDESDVTDNMFVGNLRNDWLFSDDSPWRIFANGTFEFDEFQDWDVRLSGSGGPGYEFYDDDKTFLLGRIGVGLTREIGGSENAIIPEGVLGIDFKRQLTERQKVTATVDYLPELSDLGPYRVNSEAAWEMLVDPEVNMSLKIGITDRYDSSPGLGFNRNDLDYFAMLVWSF